MEIFYTGGKGEKGIEEEPMEFDRFGQLNDTQHHLPLSMLPRYTLESFMQYADSLVMLPDSKLGDPKVSGEYIDDRWDVIEAKFREIKEKYGLED